MKKFFTVLVIPSLLITLNAQIKMEGRHGDQRYILIGYLDGNEIATSLYNDGTTGARKPVTNGIQVIWPQSGKPHLHVAKYVPLISGEVIDLNNQIVHIASESHGTETNDMNNKSCGDLNPSTKEWWTMCPLPDFADFRPDPLITPDVQIATKSKGTTWPLFWPDIEDPDNPRYSPDGWAGSWNGYFGRDQFNADQEVYFVADDYNNQEFMFYPDSTDSTRRGLGVRLYYRGLQWANPLVKDVIFTIYDIENLGTHFHDKMVFGFMVGSQFDTNEDDRGGYVLEENLAYNYIPSGFLSGGDPAGTVAFTIFESPGNPYDGIDNDGDGSNGAGPIIDRDLFAPKVVNLGDPIILTNYYTYERTVTHMTEDTVFIKYLKNVDTVWVGKTVVEIPNDLIDNNLNGIIDENNGTEVVSDTSLTRYLHIGKKYKDWFTGAGLTNPLIDERRDDGIDNNDDWNANIDDVGRDGKPNTFDPGENDGLPTAGEPHIDQTDINESDMIGLSSFQLYATWEIIPLSNDEAIWNGIRPGILDDIPEDVQPDILYGIGYFPLATGQIERFSIAGMIQYELDDIIHIKHNAEKAYLANYNFARPPDQPNIIRAVAGDNQVTLYWDNISENSYDRITNTFDFEGYKILRSTDTGWGDMKDITNGFGVPFYKKPIAQFDLINEYEGFSETPLEGVQYWLGNNTGLVHTFVDTTVRNGFTYYYAVIAYDHGSDSLEIAPSECSAPIILNPVGGDILSTGPNVAVVRPVAPAAGYVGAEEGKINAVQGYSNSDAFFTVTDPLAILDGHTYELTFKDTLIRQYPETKSFTLADITNSQSPDTLFNNDDRIKIGEKLPVVDGFQLSIFNKQEVAPNIDKTKWNRTKVQSFYTLRPYSFQRLGLAKPCDYRITVSNLGVDTSLAAEFSPTRTYPSVPVNFIIENVSEGKRIDFVFAEEDTTGGVGKLSCAGRDEDVIIFMEEDTTGNLAPTWEFEFSFVDTNHVNPELDDIFTIIMEKPFTSNDILQFTTHSESIDLAKAKTDLNKIKVVPNPYVVTNSYETWNPYNSGRGPREIQFTHLPAKCTIRIFNVRGQLIRKIERNAAVSNGTEAWDMLTRDNMDIGYGVYIYHVDAGAIGTKIGKFAVIK